MWVRMSLGRRRPGRSTAQVSAIFLLAATAVFAATDPLPEGPVKKTLESACSGCHTLAVVTNKKWDRQKWHDVIQDMAARGAILSKEETEDVVGYLARNYGPQDRGKVLVEEICSFCHGLARLKDQSLTRDEWKNVIKGMVDEGAPVTDQEFSLILDYLEKNLGPEQRAEEQR